MAPQLVCQQVAEFFQIYSNIFVCTYYIVEIHELRAIYAVMQSGSVASGLKLCSVGKALIIICKKINKSGSLTKLFIALLYKAALKMFTMKQLLHQHQRHHYHLHCDYHQHLEHQLLQRPCEGRRKLALLLSFFLSFCLLPFASLFHSFNFISFHFFYLPRFHTSLFRCCCCTHNSHSFFLLSASLFVLINNCCCCCSSLVFYWSPSFVLLFYLHVLYFFTFALCLVKVLFQLLLLLLLLLICCCKQCAVNKQFCYCFCFCFLFSLTFIRN